MRQTRLRDQMLLESGQRNVASVAGLIAVAVMVALILLATWMRLRKTLDR